MLATLFGDMPREFGKKRIFCKIRKEFERKIHRYNGLIDCYATIYSIREPRKYDTAIVDKIFLDFDNTNSFESVKKAHKVLNVYDIQHCILFSGGGYHIYVFVKPTLLQNPKYAIKQAQNYITTICGLTIGKPKEADVDEHIIGDVARIARLPYTMNMKYLPRRWCFPISEEMLNEETHENIIKFSESANVMSVMGYEKDNYIYGNNKLDIMQYDGEPQVSDEMFEDIDITKLEEKYGKDEYSKFVKPLMPFVQELLYTTQCGYYDRYFTILCMKELGYPMELTTLICKHYWTPQKFRHCVIEEGQIQYLYKRQDLFFPKPETLRRKNFHISKKDAAMINGLYK